ncbi:MAG: hypothetical protein ABR608_15610 [Pseudonocardiaceae bacterium]
MTVLPFAAAVSLPPWPSPRWSSAAAGTPPDPRPVDVEDIQEEGVDGVGDSGVFEDAESFAGQQVTVSAEVSEIISPNAFTIAGDENIGLGPLLVVVYDGSPQLTEETAVQVTGTVMRAFSVGEAEDFAGADFDDGLFGDFDSEAYIQASSVDTTVPPTTSDVR